MPLQHSTGGGVNRLRFVKKTQGPIFNKYIVGSGVGGVSRANHAALRRRANNNAQQHPCCRPTFPRQNHCDCKGCFLQILGGLTHCLGYQQWLLHNQGSVAQFKGWCNAAERAANVRSTAFCWD